MEKQEDSEAPSSPSKPSTSGNSEIVPEDSVEIEEKPAAKPSADDTFQDSDLEDYCQLQHYNRDDPSATLNDSSSCTSASASPVKRPQNIVQDTNQTVKLATPQKANNDPYDVSTNESSDEDIPTSPVLNKNPSRKRVKLSNQSSTKSSTLALSASSVGESDSAKVDKRESEARLLCNAIVDDFNIDGLFDDSSNEFVDKRM